MQHETIDRNARRRRAMGLLEDLLGLPQLDIAHEIIRGVEIAVADRRDYDVADAPSIDAGNLRCRYAHALRSATKRAAIFSTSPSRPKGASARSASITRV